MDKLLKVDFFKKKGFTTKKDGLEFISKHKDLSNIFDKRNDELSDFHNKIVESFSTDMNNYENSLKEALIASKETQKLRIKQKKDNEKEMMKKQIIAEYETQKKEEEIKKEKEKIINSEKEEKQKMKTMFYNIFEPILSLRAKIKESNQNQKDIEKIKAIENDMENILYKYLSLQKDYHLLCKKYNFEKIQEFSFVDKNKIQNVVENKETTIYSIMEDLD